MNSNLNILVIDDDDAVRDTLCENLRESGHAVMEARDGDCGLALIPKVQNLDLVVTDIIMPRKEGLETIIQIRKDYPSIKLIAISGGGRTKSADFLDLARKFGADATMPKPVDMDELDRIINTLFPR